MGREHNTRLIKEAAKSLGFMYCGISKAGFLEDEARKLEQWLNKGMHGKMSYMENHFDKRLDPTKLVEGAKSVISLLLNYYPSQAQTDPSAPRISKYAYGKDYHHVIREKLKQLFLFIQENIGEVGGRVFVDSAPVMDKAWAEKGGLGWIGKNTNLISKGAGSYFFVAELIIDLELEYDGPVKDYCGSCTRCIDACPTGAITAPYIVDGSRCISYFTIELKEQIPSEMQGRFNNWVFGCDICQDVCPWNRFSKAHSEPQLNGSSRMLEMTRDQWYEITEELFGELFKDSPVKRTGYKGLRRNLEFLSRD
jgi:epoxyqueuosine reductase